MSRFIFWVSLFFTLLALFLANMYAGWLVYYAYPHVVYDGEPKEIVAWIDQFYPRFRIEAQRLGESEMKRLIKQMVIRIDVIVLLAWLTVFYRYHIKEWLKEVLFRITRCDDVLTLWRLYHGFMAFYVLDLCVDLWKLDAIKVFYKPTWLMHYIWPTFPPMYVWATVAAVGLLLLALQIMPGTKIGIHFWGALAAWLIFVVLQQLAFSFEKVEHTYTTFNYFGFFLMPAILLRYGENNYFKWSWPVGYARLAVALVYFFAGLEKLLISGTAYFKADTFQYFLKQHNGFLSEWVRQQPLLCAVLPAAAMILQLVGSWGLLYTPTRKWLASCFIAFHLGTYLLLGVGGLLSPWIAVMLLFILERSPK